MPKTDKKKIYRAYEPNELFIRAHFPLDNKALGLLNNGKSFHGFVDKMGKVRWPLIYYNKQHRKRRAWQSDLILKEVMDYNGQVVLIPEDDFWDLFDRKVIIYKKDYYNFTLPKAK